MKKVLTFLVIGLLSLSEPPSTSGSVVLKYPVGARAIGMGNAYVAVASDINSIYWNPAGLFLIESREVSASCIEGVADDVYYGHVSYAQPVDFRYIGSLGLSIATLHGGEIEIHDAPGIHTLTASQDYVFTFSGANDFSDFLLPMLFNLPGEIFLGFNLKGIRSTLLIEELIEERHSLKYSTASSFSFDLGGLYRLEGLFSGFPVTCSLGLCLQNLLGTEMTYVEKGDSLPSIMILGGALKALPSEDSEITLALDLNKPSDEKGRLNFGVEYWLRGIIAIRGGYKLGYEKERFAFGFGFPYGNFRIDYAFAPIEDLKSTHRISFTVRF